MEARTRQTHRVRYAVYAGKIVYGVAGAGASRGGIMDCGGSLEVGCSIGRGAQTILGHWM